MMRRTHGASIVLLSTLACGSQAARIAPLQDEPPSAPSSVADTVHLRLSVVGKDAELRNLAERAFRRGLQSAADVEFVSAGFDAEVLVALAQSLTSKDLVAVSACVVDLGHPQPRPTGTSSSLLLHDVRVMDRSEFSGGCEEFAMVIAHRCFDQMEELRDALRQGETDLIDVDDIKRRDR